MAKKRNIITASPEITALRIELLRRGWSVSDLAVKCGVPAGGMTVDVSSGGKSRKNRARIERCLDMVLWSSQADFNRRSRIFERIGVDPGFHDLSEILAAAQRAGIDVTGARKEKSKLIRRIEEFIAARPNFNTTPKPQNP